MRSWMTYAAGFAFCAFGLLTLNWYIETSIAAGTLVYALLTLVFLTIGFGLLALHNRAETRREQARERRYQAQLLRDRLAEETEAWRRERYPWN